MLKTNGSPGPQMPPQRAWRVEYECIMGDCKNKFGVELAVPKGQMGVQVPEMRCTQCPGLPVMGKSIPKELRVAQIVTAQRPPLVVPR